MKPSSQIMGNLSSPLWIVTISPRKADDQGPLSSLIGKQVLDHIYNLGLSIKDIRFDYLWYQPVGQGGIYLVPERELDKSIAELKDRIREGRPNLVLFMGAECLKNFLHQNSIMDWGGHVIWNEELGCKTLYTQDPHMAHVQRFVEKKEKPGQYVTLMNNHIRKAVDESKTPTMNHFQSRTIIAPTFSQARDFLLDAIENAKIISYDIEVFEPYDGRLIDCIGIATNWNNAICIPFYIEDQGKAIRYWKNDSEFYTIYSLLKQLMESNIPKVAQNSQFDTTMLSVYMDIHTKNLMWDTMVAAHNLYCDLPKTLGTLISLYTNLPYHKFLIHVGGSVNRWEYNAMDAIANLHVFSGQVKEFCLISGKCVECCDNKEKFCNICQPLLLSKNATHYLTISNTTIEHCISMHIAGIRVDGEMRQRILDLERGYMGQLIEAFNHAFPITIGAGKDGMKLNPNASGDRVDLVFDYLGCAPIYKKTKKKGKRVEILTADKKALKLIAQKDNRSYVKTLATALSSYSKSKASILVFSVELDKGRIRTQYDVTGTETGRLASRASDVMKGGTNLQNVAKGPQRRMMLPEEGEEFALVDLYAAEAYLNALDAGETQMIEMISGRDCPTQEMKYGARVMSAKAAEDYKIHNWMQRETQKRFPEETEKYNYTYKLAKQSIHGLNYGVEPAKMSLESGLPQEVTQWQYDMYHAKFGGIKMRMSRINKQLQATRSISSPLGRRRIFLMDYGQEMKNMAYAWPNQSTIGEAAEIAMNYLHTISNVWEASGGKIGVFCRPSLNTHDGLAIRVELGTREKVIPYILNAFRIPLTINGISIIIPVSIGWGPNFNDMFDEMVYFYE